MWTVALDGRPDAKTAGREQSVTRAPFDVTPLPIHLLTVKRILPDVLIDVARIKAIVNEPRVAERRWHNGPSLIHRGQSSDQRPMRGQIAILLADRLLFTSTRASAIAATRQAGDPLGGRRPMHENC